MENILYNTAILRRQNKNRIFRYIYNNNAQSTKQIIASDLALSLPTVTQNLQELENEQLINFCGTTQSTGGRKPRLIDINSSAKFSIGISVTKNHLRIVCINLRNEEMFFEKILLKNVDFSKIHTLIANKLNLFIEKNAINTKKILGVCVALPGVFNLDKTYIETAPTLKLKNYPLNLIVDAINFPCHIDNDANLGALTKVNDCENFVYLSVDRGIGGAIVLNKMPYAGNTGKSAEFGHMCIDTNGPLCNCGKTGCLEAYCSIDRISDDMGCYIEDFFDNLQSNNEKYVSAFNLYLKTLAKAINNIHMAMDCDIVIGGTLVQFLSPYLIVLKDNIMQLDAFNNNADYVHLSSYGSKTTCMGAAIFFIQNFINSI